MVTLIGPTNPGRTGPLERANRPAGPHPHAMQQETLRRSGVHERDHGGDGDAKARGDTVGTAFCRSKTPYIARFRTFLAASRTRSTLISVMHCL
ncbi:MAG: hypothetical protein MZV70_42260 [Desulfobacterales bacterium]|nr:hypothetical protein [Desulfobacterales bacterium]